jgi:hypothetical protein
VDDSFKTSIVKLIIKGDVEEALRNLSERFKVKPPKIRVGTVKGHRKASAVYRQYDKTIYASNREALYNPMIILHEYYHYLQSELYGKKGNEKYADKFAKDFIQA